MHLTRQLIHASQRDIAYMLKNISETVCRGEIKESYIQRSMNRFKYGFVYRNDDNQVEGFCVWKILEDEDENCETYKYMKILLICAKKQSLAFCNRLFVDIDNYCASNNVAYVCLIPGNETLKSYYELYGFKDAPFLKQSKMMCKEIAFKMSSSQKGQTRRRRRNTKNNAEVTNNIVEHI